jgi:sensor histidine kinase YesM
MRQSGSSVRRELDLARSYLTILQFRMGDRLAFSVDADAGALDVALPPMVLPTLVENAIKHGLSPLPEGGRIDVRARAPKAMRWRSRSAIPARAFARAAAPAWVWSIRASV